MEHPEPVPERLEVEHDAVFTSPACGERSAHECAGEGDLDAELGVSSIAPTLSRKREREHASAAAYDPFFEYCSFIFLR